MNSDEHNSSSQALNEKQVSTLAHLLYRNLQHAEEKKRYAKAKAVLSLLGMGVALTGVFLAPKAAFMLAKALQQSDDDWHAWKQFNEGYLRQTLRRLAKQKLVDVQSVGGRTLIVITQAGKKRIFEYAVDELSITKPKKWDKKWRVVIYDIPQSKKRLQETVSRILKHLGFLPIQESVYLLPYPCYKEIEFLREYYGAGQYIKYLLVEKLEEDSVYKTYFGLPAQ